jgi:hypothetical protein
MYKFKVPNKNIGLYINGDYRKPLNRYSFEVKHRKYSFESYYATVIPILEGWFNENNIQYSLDLVSTGEIDDNNGWYINFMNLDDLLLFKLTWL